MRAWIFGIVMASAALIVGCGDGGGSGGNGGSGASGGSGGNGGDGGDGGGTTTTAGTTGNTTTPTNTSTLACGVIFDDRPECQGCMESLCCSEMELCAPGTDCDALLICANACAANDEACIQACVDAHPVGLTDFFTVQDCYTDNCEQTLECSYPICDSGLVVPDQACGTCLGDSTECCAALTACAADQSCLNCLSDPMGAGCDANTAYQASDSCFSDGDKCGKSCTTGICDSGLAYPNFPACNWCLGQAAADGGCCEETTACANDTTCLACITGQMSGATCDNNALLTAFNTCRMANCSTDCGL